MEQRQLRLGDILDDYCPRERRLTNHAVVAMVGADVKQTRCATCEAEHEYKHGKLPRQRRKSESPAALYAQVAANAPKRVPVPTAVAASGDHADVIEASAVVDDRSPHDEEPVSDPVVNGNLAPEEQRVDGEAPERGGHEEEEGPVHRPLIRASLPREGQPPPVRPIPQFTIRQPGGRPNRFRSRSQRGGPPFQGDRTNGNGPGSLPRGGPRHDGGRSPQGAVPSRLARRHGSGRKRQK